MDAQTERFDIRMPIALLKKIDFYKEKEGITNRTSALLELIRIGLNSDIEKKCKMIRGESQRIDIRIPVTLIKRIEEYQQNKNIKTRAGAMKELAIIGLEEQKVHF